ncbi:hypothetical protein [Kitasatospora sp. NPDC085879]|uniref:hypothetical protein n=1 Tax=Kitasatospora sp. NPDC085879 TaxID=3154769 RepID=UPI00342F1BF6
MTAVWERAGDAAEVHALLRACDAHQAERSGTAAPDRSLATTEALVRLGAVHLLRSDGRAVAMFTLTTAPRPEPATDDYPPASNPVYLSRLAVAPDLLADGTLMGVRCVRKAVQLAGGTGADALRAEANPDLVNTRAMLADLGFEQHGPVHADETGRRYVRLQRTLRPGEKPR